MNARIDGSELVYNDYCDIGIAVSAPKGLMVPVIRNAESLSLAEIESTIPELAGRAREGKLSLEEMTGERSRSRMAESSAQCLDTDHQPAAKCHSGHA